MSQWDKIISKIKNLSKDLRFEEIKKVLESYGYTMHAPNGGSSHRTFRKQNCNPITIPENNPIKIAYIKQVKEIIENEDVNNENK